MSFSLDRRQFLMLPLMAGVVRIGEGLRIAIPRDPVEHPDPRPGITAAKILSRESYEAEVRRLGGSEKFVKSVHKRVSKSYEQAREIPEVLDGLYCYCDCSSYGHRSLLTCFEVTQAVGCWSCKKEADMAYRLHKEGKSLDEIRKAIDEELGD